MTILRTLLAGAAVLAGTVVSAGAADLYGSTKDRYMPAPAYTSGSPSWYVRGDIGWGTHADPTLTEARSYDLFDNQIDDTWTLGGGIGYYFSKSVRADVTWDHRFEADVSGTSGPVALTGTRQFGLKSDVILANLYYDFDTRSRFTPYIGIGLGMTSNRTTSGCTGAIAGDEKWSVAGAFMTGLSINFGGSAPSYGGSIKDAVPMVVDSRGRWNLDAGYRLLYLGDAKTGDIASNCLCTTTDVAVKDIWTHEFRVGLRYDFR